MSIKDLKDALEKGKLVCGIRQTLKLSKGKKKFRVFVAKDTRESTLQKLREANIKFEVLKSKEDIAKELNLGFESEVYLIK